jgi:hypothetical protein
LIQTKNNLIHRLRAAFDFVQAANFGAELASHNADKSFLSLVENREENELLAVPEQGIER